MEAQSILVGLEDDTYYPESDGEPMAEGDAQLQYMIYCVEALKLHFAAYSTVYVSGNILFYYEMGDRDKSFSPDVFVVFGVEKRRRPKYKIWEEGKAPDFIIEITSHTTRRRDVGFKKDLYERLGVTEYYLYDPTGDYLRPQLKAFFLDEKRHYVSVPIVTSPFDSLKVHSPVLDLELRVERGVLRFFDPETQEYLPSSEKLKQIAETEALARKRAELMVEAEALARAQAERFAKAETEAREQAERLVKAETDARAKAEALAASLMKELEALKQERH
ncbi:MAG: Uma2 family endonuclease [Pseudomonadota bacterium]